MPSSEKPKTKAAYLPIQILTRSRASLSLSSNSLKHAFDATTKDGEIKVSYDVSGTDWQLAVSDNGSGKPDGVFAQPKTGLAAGVVKALAKQLDAQVVTMSGALGTEVSVLTPHLQPRNLTGPPQPIHSVHFR